MRHNVGFWPSRTVQGHYEYHSRHFDAVDGSLFHLIYLLFIKLHIVTLNSSLYSNGDKCEKVTNMFREAHTSLLVP